MPIFEPSENPTFLLDEIFDDAKPEPNDYSNFFNTDDLGRIPTSSKSVLIGNYINQPVVELKEYDKEFLDKLEYHRASNEKSKYDVVHKPAHYNKGGIECLEAIKASMTAEGFTGYLKGNVLKYIWRYEDKGVVQDLEKAKVYLTRLIEELKN